MKPRDPKEGLSNEALQLLRGAQGPRRRTEDERTRTAGRVAKIGVVPLVAGSVWLSWKGAVLGAALLAVGGAAVVLQKRATDVPTTVAARPLERPVRVAPRPVVALPVPTATQIEVRAPEVVVAPPPAPVVARVVPRRPALVVAPSVVETPAPAVVAAPAPVAPSLATAVPPEPALNPVEALEHARRLLRSDPEAALRMADRVTGSGVEEERERIAIDALHRLGRRDAMRTRAEAFLQRYPRSLYGERVRSLLANP